MLSGFDNAFSLENGIGINIGPIGVVVFEEDGGYRAIDTSTLDEATQEKVAWGNLYPQALPKYLPADFEVIEDNPVYDEKAVVEETYEPYLTEGIIEDPWISLDDVDMYSEYATAVTDFFESQQALFISGEQDIDDDATWQAYVDGLESLGLSEYLRMKGVETVLE